METDIQHVPTFDEVAALMRGAAVKIGEQLPPGGAWVPVMVGQYADGAITTPPIDLTEHFDSDAVRHRFYRGLPEYIWQCDLRTVALVLPAWATTIGPNADGTMPDWQDRARPRDDPNRVDVVTVTVASAERVVSWDADVTRTPAGPRLSGDWRMVEHDGVYCGELVGALRRAFA